MKRVPPGYSWRVVRDPSGDFAGRLFRWSDIALPGVNGEPPVPLPWPEGMIFEHIRTGERVEVRRGVIVRKEKVSCLVR